MIEVKNLIKSFNNKIVLNDISFKVERGQTCVILGGSGMGKSVLLKHIIGLMKPDDGSILIDGAEITQMSSSELKNLRSKFGMVFQSAALFDSMSAFDNVAFIIKENNKKITEKDLKEKVNELFAMFSLDVNEHGKKFPSMLSGGQKKRVALARAVALNPEIILYDEPTTGLDPITTDQVDEMILSAQKKLEITSIVISHDIASAFKIADILLFIYNGQIVASGNKNDLLNSNHPFVQSFFSTYQHRL